MKKAFLILSCFSYLSGYAQKIEKFYDYNWKRCDPSLARYFSLIEFKDSLWHRSDYYIRERKLQMQGAYRDSSSKTEEGLFRHYHANGRLQAEGKYVNGKKQGIWLRYYNSGMMHDSVFYVNGQPSGTALGWYPNGNPKDSSAYKDDGTAVKIEWFDNGNPSSAGRTKNEKLHGRWAFYHKNGNISARETYDQGILTTREYFDEEGKLKPDTSNRDRPARFKGGHEAWGKHLLSKLYFPNQYRITGADKIVIVISAIIDEEGKVTDAEIYSSFHPDLDEIALKAVKSSPKWDPSVSHNRNVKYYIRQPVTFSQEIQ
ncbi:MAG: energy transducer TonB [Chitinophagaceae bacterium]|nr:energy transducer TonB [Chitinophagaceae bacterium]